MDEENVLVINEEWSIPLDEIAFRFATSSGPGGQHVNKSETKAILFFNIAQSPSIPDSFRERLLQKLATRLDSQGVLQIQAQDSRSQYQNRTLALARLQDVLREGLKVPKKRRPTRPSTAVREKRLAQKKQRGQIKQDRRKNWGE